MWFYFNIADVTMDLSPRWRSAAILEFVLCAEENVFEYMVLFIIATEFFDEVNILFYQ